MNEGVRGFQIVPIDPNYVLRRWYYPAGTPGTRPHASTAPEAAPARRASPAEGRSEEGRRSPRPC